METRKKNTKTLLQFLSLAALAATILSSCTKGSTSDVVVPPVAAITFVQASPNQPTLNLYINGGKQNTTAINFADYSSYFSADAGIDSIKFYNYTNNQLVYSNTLNLAQNTYYSMYLIGKSTAPSLLLTTDTLSKPTSGNAGVRFLNLSPDAPAVDLVIKDGAKIVSNQPYKGSSGFVPVISNIKYTIEVHQAGTNVVLATFPNANFNAGYLYTVWLGGLVANTGSADKLVINVITTAYFL